MEAANLPTFLKSRNTENHRHLYCLANVATLPSPFTFIHHVAICGLWKGTLSSQSKILLFDALQLYYRRLARCLVFRPSVRPSMGHGCIVAKRCKIGPRLILITNRKPYRLFQVIWKSLILDNSEGQYCNSNCIGCSTSTPATAGPLACKLIHKLWQFRLHLAKLCKFVGAEAITIQPSGHLRVLGVIMSSGLSLEKHVSAVSATCFFHLRQIRRVRQSLDVGSAKTVVQAFVTSRVDYCNAVLAE